VYGYQVDTSVNYPVVSGWDEAITKEAMVRGTPHVLSDNINVRSADWFQGLIYEQLDHRNLAEKIVQLLRDEKLRRRIGEKSRKTALEIFDLEKTMKQWETVYHKLKGSARARKTRCCLP